jgi:hypothetical protein
MDKVSALTLFLVFFTLPLAFFCFGEACAASRFLPLDFDGASAQPRF